MRQMASRSHNSPCRDLEAAAGARHNARHTRMSDCRIMVAGLCVLWERTEFEMK